MFSLDYLTGLFTQGAAKFSRLYPHDKWSPGKKLKILLAGYGGARNTGGDARIHCIAHLCQHLLGPENIELGVLTLNKKNVQEYFDPSIHIIEFDSLFFKDILKAASHYHMALLSDGALFTSKFANALTLFFCEVAGVMKKQKKPCLAFGCDAGAMDGFVKKIVHQLCPETYFLARTEPSLKIATQLGLKGSLGTDPAWILHPSSPEWAHQEIRSKGSWEGQAPLLALLVTNPFCWPIRPSLTKLIASLVTGNKKHHYKKWYFYNDDPQGDIRFQKYLEAVAHAANNFAGQTGAQVILTGMEERDDPVCQKFSEMIASPVAFFSPRDYNAHQISGLLQAASVCLTSDYHAGLFSMTGGVPSIAISIDERLDYLFEESHRSEYNINASDPKLQEKLTSTLEKLWTHRGEEREKILKTLPSHLKRLAHMGSCLRKNIAQSFPGLPLPPEPPHWTGYLPPLSDSEKLRGAKGPLTELGDLEAPEVRKEISHE